MRKGISALVALALVFSMAFVGCQKQADAPKSDKYKIAIYTGTVSQGEEEFRAAENLAKKYPGKVVTMTYPDNFSKEQETVIANAVQLVQDPAVKALVMVQSVPGSAAAFAKVREIRPDVLIISGVPGEDPGVASKTSDMVLAADELAMGKTIPAQAKALGAKTFVHYSFPRHMSYPLLAQRRDIMKAECEKIGLKFVYAEAPDPLGDAGVPGAQQFILRDVPAKVKEYGKDTNFFSTNCAMQEPLIKAVLDSGAIDAQQCCPSPFHGYPGALGIEIPADKAGDVPFIVSAIKEKIAAKGGTGRFSTWPLPINMAMIDGAYEYACQYAEGKIKSKNDAEAMKKIMSDIAKVDMTFVPLEENGTKYDNYYMILAGFITL